MFLYYIVCTTGCANGSNINYTYPCRKKILGGGLVGVGGRREGGGKIGGS